MRKFYRLAELNHFLFSSPHAKNHACSPVFLSLTASACSDSSRRHATIPLLRLFRLSNKRCALITFITTAMLFATTNPAMAQRYDWSFSAGTWGTPAYWTPNGTPTDTDEVFINNGGQATIESMTGPAQAHSLYVGISNSGQLLVRIGGRLSVSGDVHIGGSSSMANGLVSVSTDMSVGGDIYLESGGTAELAVDGTLNNGNYSGNISNNGSLIFSPNSTQTLSGNISGTGTLTKQGSNTLILSGTNTYVGETLITNGTLKLEGEAGNLSGNLRATAGHLEAANLGGPSLSFENTATAAIGTLDLSTQDTTLKLMNTSSAININSFLFGTGRTLTIDSNSAFTFGGNMTVSGKNNRIISNFATAIPVSSLTFRMDDAQAGDTLLDAGGKIQTTTTTTTGLTADKALAQFTAGDTVTLISNLAPSSYSAQSGVAATYGATDYYFDVGLEGTSLIATYADIKTVNQDYARGYAYGISARSVALNNAYDNTLNVLHNWQMAAPGTLSPTTVKFDTFAQLSAAHTKTKTGSHVDNDGITFSAGAGWELPMTSSSLLLGLFVEGGTGSYDSYNSFVRGSGDTWHYGAGGFAKYRMSRGTYFEGSVRTGRTKSDLDSKSVADYGYDSTSWYWGAHAGIGQEWGLSKTGTLDTYLKAIWTRMDSDTVTTKAREKLHFDSVDSIRSRLGARYTHMMDTGLKVYAGTGWEYEFDGKVKSSLYDQKIHGTNELEGHSGLIEAGLEWHAGKWMMNAQVEGLVGRREGVSGMFMANYRF